MGRVGPGAADDRVHFLEQGPDLGRVSPEGPDVGVFHGIEALPEAAGAAEVGDAGLHRDAGAGQGDEAAVPAQDGGQFLRGDFFGLGVHGLENLTTEKNSSRFKVQGSKLKKLVIQPRQNGQARSGGEKVNPRCNLGKKKSVHHPSY